ncbi:MAG: NAD-dependent epimerase/dehydratase family protein [Psychrobium sp.]
MTHNILIIGSGWLGLPLAKSLIQQGHQVTTTTTNLDKVSTSDVPMQLLNTDDNNSLAAVNNDFDVMIITIPPNRKVPESYFPQLNILQQLAITKGISKVLFTSSTSVWGNYEGIVDEDTPRQPVTQSAQAMVKFETALHQEEAFNATTIHLAGLIGNDRNPGRFLAGKTDVANASAPVNLVAKEDVIGMICQIIRLDYWQQSLIACAPTHPTRQEFYTTAAQTLGLTPPQFSNQEQAAKTINGQQSADRLQYQYQYPDLLKWLTNQ